MGYHRAGFDVVGVDINPQPNYPFECVEYDALDAAANLADFGEVFGLAFDAIHASPPCQFATTLEALQDRTYANLIPETRRRLEATWLPYVIENVVGARDWLQNPFRLCGSSFGLGVWRHRLFETNWPSMGMVPPCSHSEYGDPLDVTGTGARRLEDRSDGGGGNSRKPRNLEEGQAAMGIDWMNRRELSQAIPPAYTEFIGEQLMAHIGLEAAA
jgi:DNA (cytosine-5)-methyltransferase 1